MESRPQSFKIQAQLIVPEDEIASEQSEQQQEQNKPLNNREDDPYQMGTPSYMESQSVSPFPDQITSPDESRGTTPVESQLERFLKACKEGSLRDVQSIAAKLDVTIICDNNKYTGLHVSCLNNQAHIASFLID